MVEFNYQITDLMLCSVLALECLILYFGLLLCGIVTGALLLWYDMAEPMNPDQEFADGLTNLIQNSFHL